MVVVVAPATVVRRGGRLRDDCGRPPRRIAPRGGRARGDLPAAVVVVSPGSRTSSAAQRSAHVLPARDGLPHDRQDSPMMFGSAEEPKLRAEGMNNDKK